MIEIKTSSELIRRFEDLNIRPIPPIIGIDGVDGSGKTYLAKEIGNTLNIPIFSFDDFLDQQRKAYLEYIRYSELESEIRKVSGSKIIEGVFLLLVANKINIKITDLVYIKRISKKGICYNEHIINADEPVDEYIENLNQELNGIPDLPLELNGSNSTKDKKENGIDPFTEQMIRYHVEYKPIEIAEYIFERIVQFPNQSFNVTGYYNAESAFQGYRY